MSSASSNPPRRTPARASGKLLLAGVLAVLCVFAAGIGFELSRLGGPRVNSERLAYLAGEAQGGALPELWRVPEFSFPDQKRVMLGPAGLAGQVWIADFIFTTCTSVCPLLTAKMVMLQHQLTDPNLRFVSFSVDPERDVPDALARYAKEWNAGEHRWRLLSTDAKGLASIADGMHVAVAPTGDVKDPILHSSKFFLVDQRGSVRGLYDSSDDEALRRLVRDARTLLGLSPTASTVVDGTGQQLFAALGCDACHANDQLAPSLRGLAGRDVQLAGGEPVKADASYLRNALLAPGQQLVAGYLNNMPSYAEVLSSEQVDSLVSYVQTLSAPAPAETQAEPLAAAVAAGPRSVPRVPAPAMKRTKPLQSFPVTSTDPVCEMQVRVNEKTPHAEHAGHSYYFCSAMCRDAFVAAPTKYLN